MTQEFGHACPRILVLPHQGPRRVIDSLTFSFYLCNGFRITSQRSKIVNILQMTHATNFKTTPQSEIGDTINCFQTGMLLNNCFVRALCKEERPAETIVSRSGKIGVLSSKKMFANSHSTKVGNSNTGKRKPSLHFCGHPHWVETIIDIRLCNVQVHLQRKLVTRAKSHRWRSSTSLFDASRIHNNALHSILCQNTKHSELALRVKGQSHHTQYTLARLRAGST